MIFTHFIYFSKFEAPKTLVQIMTWRYLIFSYLSSSNHTSQDEEGR